MARIAESELERLKGEVSVERLVVAHGVRLARHGSDDLIGRCPFHEDRTPSLVVTPSKNLWHCLGACQVGGGPIDWVMKAEGVSFRHAVELLRRDYAPSTEAQSAPKVSSTPKLPAFANTDAAPAELLQRVVGHYHKTLLESQEALAYLSDRGLGDRELLERFQVGYANRTLAYRLPAKNRKAGAALRGQLQTLGILRQSGHEHFNGSIVVPIFDGQGRVVEMYGRKARNDLRAGTPTHLYLPGPHRGTWNREGLLGSKEVILCESLFDAMSFWAAGFRHVTASYGVEGFTAEHLQAFKAEGIERVFLAYDRDEAGERAAEKLGKQLNAEGLETFRVTFPKGMDANAYAVKVTPAKQRLAVLLRKSGWMGKGAPQPSAPPTVTAMSPAAPPAPLSPLAAEPAPEPEAPVLAEPVVAEIDVAVPMAGPERQEPSALEAAAPESLPEAHVSEHEVTMELGDRRWRIRGLDKNLSYEHLKVNVLVAFGDAFHVDQLELYTARHRQAFLKAASTELGLEERVLKRDLGQVLQRLEQLQDANIKKTLEPKTTVPAMTEAQRKAAMALLKDPQLMDRILSDYERCGVVGEENNKLVGYLAAVSRKLDEPLAVVIQSSSAAGKSSLMEAILKMVPPEERVSYSAMTGQSLFYMGESDLSHRILSIAEEEGASSASYALKLLQSEGELTIASTGKDPVTGRLVTQEYFVQGPVMIFLTTTAIDVDEELLNRCLVLSVDEGRAQTQAIHRLQRQRETLQGLLDKQDHGQLLELHQNAQRLLRPLLVANPFATGLSFSDVQTRTRRDHKKYLTLIRSIALLHQYQREVKETRHQGAVVRYIEVSQQDLEIADRLMQGVLRHTLDELPPQTRVLLELIEGMVREQAAAQAIEPSEVRFTRRQVREHTQWSNTPLKVHMKRLQEMEYLLVHSGGPRRRLVYEYNYDSNWSGSGPGLVRGGVGPVLSNDVEPSGKLVRVNAKTHVAGKVNGRSYPHAPSSMVQEQVP